MASDKNRGKYFLLTVYHYCIPISILKPKLCKQAVYPNLADVMSFDRNYNMINAFPDFFGKGFDMESYNRQFKSANVIIHARSSNVSYPVHWGPLSVKCAFTGSEFYGLNNCLYAVNDENYLVINDGNNYSSFIDADSSVESFTINFSPLFVKELMESIIEPDETLLTNFNNFSNRNNIEFIEKLYAHDNAVSPVIFQLLALTKDGFDENINQIEELYFLLFERLAFKQITCKEEIKNVQAIKHATRLELYKRLHRAKDFIDSCYTKEISLQDLANVCLLNKSYLLRQFKKYFKITPGQYIIVKRMEAARRLLEKKSDQSVSDICIQVGYSDLSSFSRLFKKHNKYSPEKYQQSFIKKGPAVTIV